MSSAKNFTWGANTKVIIKSILVLSTEPLLRKVAVYLEVWFSTEQYGCRQRSDLVFMPIEGRQRKFLTFTNAVDF